MIRAFSLGVLTLVMLFGLAPAKANAAALSAPRDVVIIDGSPTDDTTPIFAWRAADGATWYDVKIDNGSYIGIGNVFTYTAPIALSDDWHTFSVRAHNNRDAVSAPATISFEVLTISTLAVPRVSPSSAIEDEEMTFTVRPTSDQTVRWCDLYINGHNVGDMTRRTDGSFVIDHTFATAGSYTVYAHCTDAGYDSTRGESRTVTVRRSTVPDVDDGKLIKIRCGSSAVVGDTCHAVYYYGDDGKRHSFPNESVYYSWYTTFEHVTEVSSLYMASIPIGKNVTYHPGSVLMQFASGEDIYAVAEPNTLRRYVNISLLRDDYSDTWESFLVKVPDTTYGNYSLGSVIDSSSDYDRGEAWEGAVSIDDLF